MNDALSIGDISTTIMTSSAALLGLSALILVTIRLGNYGDIKERISRRDYNRLYDWTYFSFISGALSVMLVLVYLMCHTQLLVTIAGVFTGLQLATLSFAFIRSFWPPKCFDKSQRDIWRKTREYEKKINEAK